MFLVIAAVVDKLYISEAIQIPVITGLIVATFGMIILSIPLVAYYARGDNYLEGHIPQRDEPIDLPFHGGRVVETALNYDPDSKSDLEAIESGDLIPRHDIPLYLTEDKDLSDLFPELDLLGIKEVSTIHLRYHLHFKDRFDLSTGAIVVRKGVPLYHPHAEEVNMIPVGVDYYDGIANPVFEITTTRKGDYAMLANPNVMDKALSVWVNILKRKGEEEAPATKAEPPASGPAPESTEVP